MKKSYIIDLLFVIFGFVITISGIIYQNNTIIGIGLVLMLVVRLEKWTEKALESHNKDKDDGMP